MDNEDEVMTTELTRTKEVFLRETPGMAEGPPKLYNVDEEFEKTKRNKSPVVLIVALSFITVFGVASAGVTYFMQRATQRVPINIDDFRDVNLTEILDGQKRNENTLKAAQRRLADLIAEMEGEIEKVQAEASRDVEIVLADNITQSLKTTRTNQIRSQESRDIGAIRGEYGPRIEAIQAEIEEIQARIDAYDSRMVEQARESEEILSNRQQLYEIEKQELTQYYEKRIQELETTREQERRDLTSQKDNLVALLNRNHANEVAGLTLRYNPVFEDSRVLASLGRRVPEVEEGIAELPPYRETLASESALTRGQFDGMRRKLSDFDILLSRIQDVPYENSIPPALQQLRVIEKALIADYEGFWNRLTSVVEQKNSEIGDLETTVAERETTISRLVYAIDTRVDIDRENGFVLDPRDPEDIYIHVNPDLPVQDGDTGYVFRNVDEFIGTVVIRTTPAGLRARLVSLENEKIPVDPFDKILIQLQ